jgi:hypothetical protein
MIWAMAETGDGVWIAEGDTAAPRLVHPKPRTPK